MKPEFRTQQLEAQPILGIRETTTMDKLAQRMGPLFGEVHGHMTQHGQTPAGMPLARYHSMDGNTVELECAIPVASPLAGTDRIQAGELPAGTMATVTHMGPYDDLPTTWAALTAWMKEQGLDAAGAPWEVYVTDPGKEPDKSRWRTDIFFPVR
jgi:AraC family transcriptional regulator